MAERAFEAGAEREEVGTAEAGGLGARKKGHLRPTLRLWRALWREGGECQCPMSKRFDEEKKRNAHGVVSCFPPFDDTAAVAAATGVGGIVASSWTEVPASSSDLEEGEKEELGSQYRMNNRRGRSKRRKEVGGF